MTARSRLRMAALTVTVLGVTILGMGTWFGIARPAYFLFGESSLTGPSATRLWKIRLQESDSLYLGRPDEFFLDEDGSVYIADRFFGRVVQVSRDGRILRTYGRKGRGPGELIDAGQPFIQNGRLFVKDVGAGHLSEFDAKSGKFTRNHPYDGILSTAVPEENTVWLGLLSRTRGTGAARWTPGEDEFRYFARIPTSYVQSQPLAGIFNGVSVAAWGDTVMVGFMGSDDLLLFSRDGAALDTLRVPARARRGVPDDIATRLEELSFPEMFRSASYLFGLHRLPGGETALVHFDQEIEGRAITSTVYLTLVSADRRRACVDRHLPLTRDSQPEVAFRADTLFVLEQQLESENTPVTTLSAYQISGRGCDWIATG